MPTDVADALQEIFVEEGQLTKEQAEEYLKNLIRTKRFQRETWAWFQVLNTNYMGRNY